MSKPLKIIILILRGLLPRWLEAALEFKKKKKR